MYGGTFRKTNRSEKGSRRESAKSVERRVHHAWWQLNKSIDSCFLSAYMALDCKGLQHKYKTILGHSIHEETFHDWQLKVKRFLRDLQGQENPHSVIAPVGFWLVEQSDWRRSRAKIAAIMYQQPVDFLQSKAVPQAYQTLQSSQMVESSSGPIHSNSAGISSGIGRSNLVNLYNEISDYGEFRLTPA